MSAGLAYAQVTAIKPLPELECRHSDKEATAGSSRAHSRPESRSSAASICTRNCARDSSVHLDLRPENQAAGVACPEQLGARRVDVGQGPDVGWVVMADPDGSPPLYVPAACAL